MEHGQRGCRVIHIFGVPANPLLQSFINGSILGWIYVLIAMGLSQTFGIMRTFKFAQRGYGRESWSIICEGKSEELLSDKGLLWTIRR